jgi:glycerol-3-phosphate dehydrogenase
MNRSDARMNRGNALKEIGSQTAPWDVVVIGGGATGLGCAVDAASRGYRTLLIEQADFAKATSSRSTKLSHGGVRYLQQGNLALVLEALKERGRMLRNAPQLVRRQPFVIPAYAKWEIPFYGAGLKLYDALAGRASFGRSEMLGRSGVRALMPTVAEKRLSGGVLYFDGQFDDARYAIALARTLVALGGVAINYVRMTGLLKQNGIVCGIVARDEETGESFEIPARAVINATGVFTDAVRALDEPQAAPILTVSQGSHFVLPRSFLPGSYALMVPKTEDGRVLFAIPWHGAVVVGTTDEPVAGASLEPRALEVETGFLKHHIERYFDRKPENSEILSVWSGLRPLVHKRGASSTAALSREHTVLVSPSRLVSITGGKWTTYRRMAEDAVDIAARAASLPRRASKTQELRLHGWTAELAARMEDGAAQPDAPQEFFGYGSDQSVIDGLIAESPALGAAMHARLPHTLAEIVFAARHEMARTVEDVLARRTRSLFLDARAAHEAAPRVAACLAGELGQDAAWEARQVEAFRQIAAGYVYGG